MIVYGKTKNVTDTIESLFALYFYVANYLNTLNKDVKWLRPLANKTTKKPSSTNLQGPIFTWKFCARAKFSKLIHKWITLKELSLKIRYKMFSFSYKVFKKSTKFLRNWRNCWVTVRKCSSDQKAFGISQIS